MSINKIEPMRPLLPTAQEIAPYLKQIDSSRTYSNFGPLYQEFVFRLADYLGVNDDNIALFANGTLALQAAIETVGQQNDIWAMPSWTFVATAQAAHSARRRIHFVDVDHNNWAMQPSKSVPAAGQVIVAPFGSKPQIDDWKQTSGWKVFDAASCFDACKNIGDQLGDQSAVMISLHATKPLPAGEGAILVGPKKWVHKAKCWGNFGFDGTRIAVGPGLNAKISEYHCAVGLASLDKWDMTRTALAERAKKAVAICQSQNLQNQPSFIDGHVTTTWNVQIPGRNLNLVKQSLAAAGIGTRRWWPVGVHEMPQFTHCNRTDLTTTILLSDSVLGLPFGVDLTDNEFEQIDAALSAILKADY
jgi:dTDP-4-amino-4,6-dideoxygalactose transaminase